MAMHSSTPSRGAQRLIDFACGGMEANLPLLFSDRDVVPHVEHLGLEAA